MGARRRGVRGELGDFDVFAANVNILDADVSTDPAD
jgi:hypothetical protein